MMRGGVYIHPKIHTTNSGTPQSPITIKAYPGEEVIWKGDQTDYLWYLRKGQHWLIEGITFEGQIILGEQLPDMIAEHITIRNALFRNALGGIKGVYARHILIENCTFVNLRSNQPNVDHNAVTIQRWGDDFTIRNSWFEDIGSDGIHLGALGNNIGKVIIENNHFVISGQRSPVGENGIDVKSVQGPIIITGNTFHGYRPTVPGQDASGAQGEAIAVHWTYNNGPVAKNVTIERNLFYNNAMHVVINSGSQDITVKNNLFRDASNGTEPGIGLWVHDAVNVKILHNTFFSNPIHLRTGSTKLTTAEMKNNIFWQGEIVGFPTSGGLSIWETDYNAWSQITGDVPQILRGSNDLLNLPLHLSYNLDPSANSPVINAGANLGVITDFTGSLRQDGRPYIGAMVANSGGSGDDGVPKFYQNFFPIIFR